MLVEQADEACIVYGIGNYACIFSTFLDILGQLESSLQFPFKHFAVPNYMVFIPASVYTMLRGGTVN